MGNHQRLRASERVQISAVILLDLPDNPISLGHRNSVKGDHQRSRLRQIDRLGNEQPLLPRSVPDLHFFGPKVPAFRIGRARDPSQSGTHHGEQYPAGERHDDSSILRQVGTPLPTGMAWLADLRPRPFRACRTAATGRVCIGYSGLCPESRQRRTRTACLGAGVAEFVVLRMRQEPQPVVGQRPMLLRVVA